MNIIALTGRITADPKVNTAQNGTKYARFSVAVNNDDRKDETDFFNCVAWGSQAEFVEKGMEGGRYLTGCEVELTGRAHISTYTNQQTGQQSRNTEVRVLASFSRPKRADGHRNPENTGGQGMPYGQQAPQGGYGDSYAPNAGQPGNGGQYQQGRPVNAPQGSPAQPGNGQHQQGRPVNVPQGNPAQPGNGQYPQGRPVNVPQANAGQPGNGQYQQGRPVNGPQANADYQNAGHYQNPGGGFTAAAAAPPLGEGFVGGGMGGYPESGNAGY